MLGVRRYLAAEVHVRGEEEGVGRLLAGFSRVSVGTVGDQSSSVGYKGDYRRLTAPVR